MKIKFFFFGVLFVVLARCAFGAPTDSPQFPEEKAEECEDAKDSEEKEPDNAKYRIDEKMGFCYKINTLGPCGPKMVFTEVDGNKTYGACICDQKESDKLLILHEDTCYPIYTQGYCNDAEILKPNGKDSATCENNPCADKQKDDPKSVFIHWNSKCIKEGTSGEGYCEGKDTLQFESGNPDPLCKPPAEGHSAMPNAQSATKCPEGQSPIPSGGCAKNRTE